MKKITILICDDHDVVRKGLRSLLATAQDMEVIGEADNGQLAVEQAKQFQPDVVLMDIAMPLLNGVEAARRIALEVPATKVLALSSYNDAHHVRQVVAAGAVGYVTKESAWKDLLQAIRKTSKGKSFFSPGLVRHSIDKLEGIPLTKAATTKDLTTRQTEIVQMIAEGHSTKEIASLIAVSPKTVEKLRQAAMNKLELHEIASLTRYAFSKGIIELNRHLPRSAEASS
jgi:DNA-binding NarL/FixJ family response regulator